MPIVDGLLMEMDMEAKTTQRVLERVPEDKLTWRPHPKSFSLGQLALHVAASPGNVASAAALDSFDAPDFQQPEAKSLKEILDAFAQGQANARKILEGMDDARLMGTCTINSKGKVLMSVPRVMFIRSIMMNHLYHHRGQMTVYLRLLNIPVPSVYGPSADENPFA